MNNINSNSRTNAFEATNSGQDCAHHAATVLASIWGLIVSLVVSYPEFAVVYHRNGEGGIRTLGYIVVLRKCCDGEPPKSARDSIARGGGGIRHRALLLERRLVGVASKDAKRNGNVTDKRVAELVEELLVVKQADGASIRYRQSLRSHLRRFAATFKTNVGSVTRQQSMPGYDLQAEVFEHAGI